MSIEQQIMQYALIRARVARQDEAGEVTATTLVLAGLLIAAALAVGAVLLSRLTAKATSLNLDG